ncbi:MAG: HAD family hydrolase [bacterium]
MGGFLPGTEVEVINPEIHRGRIRHALFDFDGTISVVREGWERIMVPLMIEMICGGTEPTKEIEEEVRDYVDRSTGIQTILQMEWLSKKVEEYGLAERALTPLEYKKIYNERLLIPVRERLGRLARGEVGRRDLMIEGSEDFLRGLCDRGVVLYLASGTDREYVLEEAEALGVAKYFRGGIFGALSSYEEYSKEKVICRIASDYSLHGSELLVVGDGPVEIRNAKARNAIAVGVASDEVRRQGWNRRKVERLRGAGADILMPDFRWGDALLDYLFSEWTPGQ